MRDRDAPIGDFFPKKKRSDPARQQLATASGPIWRSAYRHWRTLFILKSTDGSSRAELRLPNEGGATIKKCWTTQPGWRNSCDAETSRHHRVCSAKRKARGGVSPACGMRNDHRMNGHAIIAADVRQFDRLINKDGVFSTHKALKTLVRTAVTLNKSRVRS